MSKKLTLTIASGILDRKLDKARFPEGTPARQDKIHKVGDHLLKMFFYIFSTTWIYIISKD